MTYGRGFMFSTRWLDITTIGLTNRNVGYIWWLTKVSVNNLILLKRKKRKKENKFHIPYFKREACRIQFHGLQYFLRRRKAIET